MTVHRLRPRHRQDGAASGVPFAVARVGPEARRAARRVLASGWATTGREAELFEAEFAARVRARHAVAVSSGTAALELALRALRLPHGAPALVPAVTFCGAAHAVVHAGLRPVLVDVDPGTAMPTPDTVERAARACGAGPRAMTVLHYGGAPAPLEELARAAGLPLSQVVEDASHALGTWVGDRPVGGGPSAAACFGFHATETLPIGEGGMLTTDDPEIAERVRRARLHGMSAADGWRHTVDEAGLNACMTDVQAAVGRAQLRHFDDWQERRRALAARYDAALAEIPGLEPLAWPTPGEHARHLYVVRVLEQYGTDRDELVERLARDGIGTFVHFVPLHHMPYFRRVTTVPPDGLPGADALFPQLLSLPLRPDLAERDLDRVCERLARYAAPAPAAVRPRSAGLRTVIVGAGEVGRALARDLAQTPEFGLDPVGFLDDDTAKQRAGTVAGLPVLGGLDDTGATVRALRVGAVVVAIPAFAPDRFRRVAQAAEGAGASVRRLPSFVAALQRDVSDLRSPDLRELIGRAETHVISPEARSAVAGRRVLVTGAGGSVGSELCRRIRAFGPSRLFLLDHDESALRRLRQELYGEAPHGGDTVIADIRDRHRIDQVFRELRPEVVFHAAADKRLPLLELHPCEGVKTNVRGTENVVRAAIAVGTSRFVLVSSDKAADPVSVLGATKRLAELLVGDAGQDAPPGTVFAAVRFGHVLGSRGSLLSVVAGQLGAGTPVTVPHPEATRCFTTDEEAVGLVLEAARTARGGEVFVPGLEGPVRIEDLVRAYARALDIADVDIRYTGLRPGEKLHETLLSRRERPTSTAHPGILAAEPLTRAIPFARHLPALYAAAEHNDAPGVRRILAALLPGFPATEPTRRAHAALADPYPDDF
ncbi:FlaA1/EpsC-like NDP-sugar epimerase/dTDP-4-amino-4,6-dideoxygalactose transaminase [Streptomyces sp. SAI-170]|uniref:DegT/DnrJ/EryC1/StrS family aminotransferase n=1 Tax=Streptomyces sp. SAI-170 TaxID=3377729 RepID=UPI003C7E6715